MVNNYFFYIFMLGLLSPLVTSRHVDFYRRDYRYISEFDAYYKIQWDMYGLSMNAALLTCYNEGAELFYPKTEGEWTIAQTLRDTQCAVPNITDIFVGVNDNSNNYDRSTMEITTDETTITSAEVTECLLMDMGTGSFKTVSCAQPSDAIVPYICKKVVETCPTVDKGYIFNKETKKCYKINNKLSTWLEAMQTCFTEGSTLTIIDDAEEYSIMKSSVITGYNKKYFIGFRKMDPSEKLYTVKGKELLEDHLHWYNKYIQEHTCGTLRYYNSMLYTELTDCNEELSFICEMDVA